jgi:hypothetical protein
MKNLNTLFIIIFVMTLLMAEQSTMAVIKRHDIIASEYDVANTPDFLIDMPHEGQGVLIASQWIVTVAHNIFYNYKGKELKIGGKNYTISEVIVHSGYKAFPKDFDYSNRLNIKNFIAERDDIALIKLSTAIQNLTPIALYKNKDENQKVVSIYGKGATGDGLKGMLLDTMKPRQLRYCNNLLIQSEGRWLSYRFDPPETAIPLEGLHGRGDSGGPSIIYENNMPKLIGLSSWQWEGDEAEFEPSLYGTIGYQVRISNYIDWIEKIIASN